MAFSAGATDTYYKGLSTGTVDYKDFNDATMWSNGFDSSYDFILDSTSEHFDTANKINSLFVYGSATGRTTVINSLTANGSPCKTNAQSGVLIGQYSGTNVYAIFQITKDVNVQSGTFNFSTRGATATAFAYGTLNVGGDYYTGSVEGAASAESQIGGKSGYIAGTNGDFGVNPLCTASIAGDAYIGGGSTFSLNVGISGYGSTYDISNSDVNIAGVVVGKSGYDSKGVQYNISDMFFSFIGADISVYLTEAERKVISWSSFDDSIVYKADNVTIFGQEYEAVFNAKADGLYVQYVAVPECATMAFIFGAIALGLAVVRRRIAK